MKTALKILVKTSDMKLASKLCSIPLEGLNEERIKARMPQVIVSVGGRVRTAALSSEQ